MAKSSKVRTRTVERSTLDRAAWLDEALEVLAEEGLAGVRVELLARRLSVTKGSFYWHFRDRPELLAAMVDRWRATQEGLLSWLRSSTIEDPAEELRKLLAFVQRKDSRHDVGLRGMARFDSHARNAVQAVDGQRLEYIEGLFGRLGFDEDEGRLRARVLYFYQVAEYTLALRDPEDLRDRLTDLRFNLLTQ